jgi:alkanesulfonate monooxygenase SsuD/methylene tetrahydromethanopterin reductase-like flavin-dependent oxidoreductase (luciferase family)
MRFITITLIVHAPDPHTGVQKSTQERFREVVENARLAEELGFDGFGVGERHERPFISSSPTVILSHLAALTTRIRLFTAVTTTWPPQWDWGGGPIRDEAVPARAVAATG